MISRPGNKHRLRRSIHMEWIGKHATISHWNCYISCGTIGGLCAFQFSSLSAETGRHLTASGL
jgi:hypothetical protein